MMKMEKMSGIFFVLLLIVGSASLFALPRLASAASVSNDAAVVTTSLVNQDPDPAAAGDLVNVRIGVANNGGQAANNVVVEVVPAYPFTLPPGDSATQNVGTILGYQGSSGNDVQIVKYRFNVDKNAPAGNYDLVVKTYEAGSTDITTKTLSIAVNNEQSAEIIYIDQVQLVPGKITPMNFTIKNVGGSPLTDLTFQWTNANNIVLPVGSDNTQYISYLDVGQSVNIPFNVIASTTATPDLYKLDLSLSYKDQATGTSTSVTTHAGVYVGGPTDFDVAFSGTSNGQASFSIANIGSVSASSVTVRIPTQPSWTVTGSRAAIIGNLNEGDYTIASFNLQPTGASAAGQGTEANQTGMQQRYSGAGSGAPGAGASAAGNTTGALRARAAQSSTVQVEIDYTDSRGNRNVIVKDVLMDQSAIGNATGFGAGRRTGAVQATPTFWATYGWYIIIALVLIVGIYAHSKVKKARVDDPAYTYGQLVKDTFHAGKRKSKK